jgi:cell shape-determining protein MreC
MFSLVFITFILFVFGLSFFFVEMIQTFSSYMNHKSEKHIEPKEGINIDISEEITDETDYSDYYNESEHKPLTNKTRVSDSVSYTHLRAHETN